MTKREKQALEAVVATLRQKVALHWTDPNGPDVPAPKSGAEGLSVGWLPAYRHVEPACSSSVHHAVGRSDKTNSQGPRDVYSTRLLALKALRHEMEDRFASELAAIDLQIEAETANPTKLSSGA